MSSIALRQEKQRIGVNKSSEWRRIEALPRRTVDLGAVPDLTRLWLIDPSACTGCDLCREGAPRLRPIQSAMLLEAERGGLFAPVGVGHGKTLAALLLPDAMQAKRAVYLVKPRLRDQLLSSDIPRYSRHFRLPLDRLTIVSYTELSNADKGDVLDRLEPDLIIADEAHMLRHASSARTKRFLRYTKDHPGCRFVPLSGSMATRSVRDFAHLSEPSLRLQSPVPFNYREVEDWSRALDPPEMIDGRMPIAPGALFLLCGLQTKNEEALKVVEQNPNADLTHPDMARELARRVFRRRLVETPGVVATDEGAVGCSLVISARRMEVPPVVKKALEQLRRLWSIDGEELRDAKDLHRYARQLACGFYYRWVWPNDRPDMEWLTARANWRGVVRNVLRRSRPGLDSPLLVARAARRGDLDVDATGAWREWDAVKERPEPPKEAVWIDRDFLFADVRRWCDACEKDGAPGIVWYVHNAVGDRLAELDIPVYGAGATGLDQLRVPFIAASIEAHKEGHNLQHFCRNLVLTPPANGATWEQMTGRTHRSGQRADEVEVEIYWHDSSLQAAFAKALEDARFTNHSTGAFQRILYATKLGMDA